MDSRLEILRNGQDITNRGLLFGAMSQQHQQQPPSADVDNESNKYSFTCSFILDVLFFASPSFRNIPMVIA